MVDRKNTIIFDLDGTLADCSPRQHDYLEKNSKDWISFCAECVDDKVHTDIKTLLDLFFNAGYTIIIITGRNEIQGGHNIKHMTIKWLENNGIRYHHLYFKATEDFRPATITKIETFNNHINKEQVLMVIDNEDSMVKAWRAIGVKCLQVG